MGLDVGLKYCANRAEELAKQDAASKFQDAAWEKAGKYEELSDAQKETVREAIKAYCEQNDLDEWGSSKKIISIEEDSPTHPEHMFKIGYLRSSYNSGGINSVLERCGVMSLYDIFQPKDDYYVTPDWNQAEAHCLQAITNLKAHMISPMGSYDCIEVNGYDPVGSKEEALALLKTELEGNHAFGGGYSNRKGDWFLEGIEIVGAVPGKPNRFSGDPTYYLFTKSKEPGGDLKWYLEALEVTLEMIQFVLAKDDMENYFLSWSA